MLRIGEDGRVVVPIVRWSLPGVCFWQRLWQLDCPGCGMTRCFIALAHADVAGAWRYNPAGLLLFAALLVQFPYRWVQLRRIARREPEIGVGRPVLLAWIAVAAIIGQWVARMFLF
jgi:hypothetical protein